MKTLDELNYYFTELLKINPFDLFSDPLGTVMNYMTKVFVGPPKVEEPVS